ncbi:MAG: N-acetyl-gamma-glutamyl-phosphate reductase [Dehalococcoidia bacterium]|nr:N-acetyl-gamma-glutamyl-phosphate reductase [Dehalococcoidia bacterium]
MKKIRAGIINVTGYAGVELARILWLHPDVELVSVTGRSAAGKKLGDVFPHMDCTGLTITTELETSLDVVFSAMTHKASAEGIVPLVKRGVRVVDISADFRLREASWYGQWYDFEHPAPELLKTAVYGLPELHRAGIASAKIVANPGCYPTSAILGLAPLVKAGLVEPDLIVDSKSGVSGAGRTLTLATHFSEASDNVRAYGLGGHRHLPEISQELDALDPVAGISVTFVPHVVPMTRGIESTCYARARKGKLTGGKEELDKIYYDFYKNESFTRVVQQPPESKHTLGSNLCLLYPAINEKTGRVVVISCIDNLVKGAAGQAVQNMNIMFGFPEKAGLEALPIYP